MSMRKPILDRKCVKCRVEPVQKTKSRPQGESFCRACRKAYQHEHYEKNRVRYNETSAAWLKAHPEKRKQITAKHYRLKGRNRFLRQAYGITADEYEQMLRNQNGLCSICGHPPRNRKRLHLDHDHVTGTVRDLLCHQCNLTIGSAQDDPSRLRAAAAYLERHQGTV